MGNNLTEEVKDVIADLLGYYGFVVKIDHKFQGMRDVIDVAVLEEGKNEPSIAVFITPEIERSKFIGKVSRSREISNNVLYLFRKVIAHVSRSETSYIFIARN